MSAPDGEAIRRLAVWLAQEHDVSVSRAEHAIRNLLVRGLIDLPDTEHRSSGHGYEGTDEVAPVGETAHEQDAG